MASIDGFNLRNFREFENTKGHRYDAQLFYKDKLIAYAWDNGDGGTGTVRWVGEDTDQVEIAKTMRTIVDHSKNELLGNYKKDDCEWLTEYMAEVLLEFNQMKKVAQDIQDNNRDAKKIVLAVYGGTWMSEFMIDREFRAFVDAEKDAQELLPEELLDIFQENTRFPLVGMIEIKNNDDFNITVTEYCDIFHIPQNDQQVTLKQEL